MPFYTKPLSQLDTADLHELLNEQAVENARLEFKLTEPDKDATLKKVSSFANTFGGYMLVGAKAESKDGRLLDLPGVDTITGYKQKVIDWCFAGASPPLNVEVSDPIPAPAKNGKVCYAIYVPESDVAPHFLNGRKGVWVRTDEFSAHYDERLANDVELRHLLDRRQMIRERRASLIARAKKRFNTYLDHKYKDRSGQRTDVGPMFEFSLVPRFPSRQLRAQSDLNDCINRTLMVWKGIHFPFSHGDILSQHESAIVLDPTKDTSIFEVNVWGMLYYAATIRGAVGNIPGISMPRFVGLVLLFIQHASRMLAQLGYSGPVTIESVIGPVLGIPWLYNLEGWDASEAGSVLDDYVEFPIHTSSSALADKPDAVAMEILRPAFYSVNWPKLIENYGPETVVKTGYEYNRWQPPPASQLKADLKLPEKSS